ncbi:MAG TPA: hypothetical protein VLE72_02080 [Candidatus Saccharimonadales bacterium]|nr:hypothetical protein [Candidatus Saccharimonadales bacterium]
MTNRKSIGELVNNTTIEDLALPSNFLYGRAIYDRGAVELIERLEKSVEAWVGGLDGTVSEGAGSRRRVQLFSTSDGLKWHCSGNPKNHQIFCKHCVALALAIQNKDRKSS